nr:unnamed protein product [Callosobruchus analis]
MLKCLGVTLDRTLSFKDHFLKTEAKITGRVVALDISKAFDRVWHEGHLAKLAAYGPPLGMRQWLNSFLLARYLFVVVVNREVRLVDAPNLTKDLHSLEHIRRVAGLTLFYRFYHGRCSSELSRIITRKAVRTRNTRECSACSPLPENTVDDDEEEAGEGVVSLTKIGGTTDTCIDMPRAETTTTTCLLEKPPIDKKVKRRQSEGCQKAKDCQHGYGTKVDGRSETSWVFSQGTAGSGCIYHFW